MKDTKVASVQFEHAPGDKQANLDKVRRFTAEAAEQGVELVVFPEMCITGYWFLRDLGREQLTALAEQVPGVNDKKSTPHRLVGRLSAPFAQGKDRGAWPSVRAALDPAAQSGEFYGPGGFSELKGSPRVVAPVASSASLEFGARLWALAEESTGQSVEL